MRNIRYESNSKKILIINDKPDYLERIKTILENTNHTVKVSYNSEEGFEAIEKERFDLLILDMMMGYGMEGILFARKIRQDQRFNDLAVLMTVNKEEQTDFYYLGDNINPNFFHANDFMKTTFDCELLLNKVNTLLETEPKHR